MERPVQYAWSEGLTGEPENIRPADESMTERMKWALSGDPSQPVTLSVLCAFYDISAEYEFTPDTGALPRTGEGRLIRTSIMKADRPRKYISISITTFTRTENRPQKNRARRPGFQKQISSALVQLFLKLGDALVLRDHVQGQLFDFLEKLAVHGVEIHAVRAHVIS